MVYVNKFSVVEGEKKYYKASVFYKKQTIVVSVNSFIKMGDLNKTLSVLHGHIAKIKQTFNKIISLVIFINSNVNDVSLQSVKQFKIGEL